MAKVAVPPRGGSVTNPNAGTLAAKRVKAPTPSDKDLIARKVKAAGVASVLAWQKKYNKAHPDGKIREDGIAGEQTRTAMGVRSYLKSNTMNTGENYKAEQRTVATPPGKQQNSGPDKDKWRTGTGVWKDTHPQGLSKVVPYPLRAGWANLKQTVQSPGRSTKDTGSPLWQAATYASLFAGGGAGAAKAGTAVARAGGRGVARAGARTTAHPPVAPKGLPGGPKPLGGGKPPPSAPKPPPAAGPKAPPKPPPSAPKPPPRPSGAGPKPQTEAPKAEAPKAEAPKATPKAETPKPKTSATPPRQPYDRANQLLRKMGDKPDVTKKHLIDQLEKNGSITSKQAEVLRKTHLTGKTSANRPPSGTHIPHDTSAKPPPGTKWYTPEAGAPKPTASRGGRRTPPKGEAPTGAPKPKASPPKAETPPPPKAPPKPPPKPKAEPPKAEPPPKAAPKPKTKTRATPPKVSPELRKIADRNVGRTNLGNTSMVAKAGSHVTYRPHGSAVDLGGTVWSPGPRNGTVWVLRKDGKTFDMLSRDPKGGWKYEGYHKKK